MARPVAVVEEFEIAPLAGWTLWTLPLLWMVVVALLFALRHEALLRPVPGSPVPAWLVAAFGLGLALAGPLILLHCRRIRIAGGRLCVQAAGVFWHKVPLAELDPGQARIVDLDEHTGLRPMARLWGMGLPGLRAGHYLLRDRTRAFCLLTRMDKVLVLPRRDGRRLLLTPARPRALLARLAELAEAPMHP